MTSWNSNITQSKRSIPTEQPLDSRIRHVVFFERTAPRLGDGDPRCRFHSPLGTSIKRRRPFAHRSLDFASIQRIEPIVCDEGEFAPQNGLASIDASRYRSPAFPIASFASHVQTTSGYQPATIEASVESVRERPREGRRVDPARPKRGLIMIVLSIPKHTRYAASVRRRVLAGLAGVGLLSAGCVSVKPEGKHDTVALVPFNDINKDINRNPYSPDAPKYLRQTQKLTPRIDRSLAKGIKRPVEKPNELVAALIKPTKSSAVDAGVAAAGSATVAGAAAAGSLADAFQAPDSNDATIASNNNNSYREPPQPQPVVATPNVASTDSSSAVSSTNPGLSSSPTASASAPRVAAPPVGSSPAAAMNGSPTPTINPSVAPGPNDVTSTGVTSPINASSTAAGGVQPAGQAAAIPAGDVSMTNPNSSSTIDSSIGNSPDLLPPGLAEEVKQPAARPNSSVASASGSLTTDPATVAAQTAAQVDLTASASPGANIATNVDPTMNAAAAAPQANAAQGSNVAANSIDPSTAGGGADLLLPPGLAKEVGGSVATAKPAAANDLPTSNQIVTDIKRSLRNNPAASDVAESKSPAKIASAATAPSNVDTRVQSPAEIAAGAISAPDAAAGAVGTSNAGAADLMSPPGLSGEVTRPNIASNPVAPNVGDPSNPVAADPVVSNPVAANPVTMQPDDPDAEGASFEVGGIKIHTKSKNQTTKPAIITENMPKLPDDPASGSIPAVSGGVSAAASNAPADLQPSSTAASDLQPSPNAGLTSNESADQSPPLMGTPTPPRPGVVDTTPDDDLPPLPDEPKNPGLSRDPNADLPPLPEMSAPLSVAPNADLPPLPNMSAPLSAAPNADLPPLPNMSAPLSVAPNADLPPLPNMSAPLSAAPNGDLPPLPNMSAPLSARPNADLPPLPEANRSLIANASAGSNSPGGTKQAAPPGSKSVRKAPQTNQSAIMSAPTDLPPLPQSAPAAEPISGETAAPTVSPSNSEPVGGGSLPPLPDSSSPLPPLPKSTEPTPPIGMTETAPPAVETPASAVESPIPTPSASEPAAPVVEAPPPAVEAPPAASDSTSSSSADSNLKTPVVKAPPPVVDPMVTRVSYTKEVDGRAPSAPPDDLEHLTDETDGNTTLVRVGTEVITRRDLDIAVAGFAEQRGKTVRDLTPWEHREVARIMLLSLAKDSLFSQEFHHLVSDAAKEKLFNQDAEKFWKTEVLPNMLSKEHVTTERELRERYEEKGKSFDDVKRDFHRMFVTNTLIHLHVRDKMKPTLRQMYEFYEKNPKRFYRPETITWREIEVRFDSESERERARSRAQMLAARLQRGEDFAIVARNESQGATASEGGLWKETFPGGFAVAAVDEELATLKPGDTSRLIEGSKSFHIVRLEKRAAAGPAPFGEVQAEIQKLVEDINYERETRQYIDEIRRRVPVVPDIFAAHDEKIAVAR